MAGPDEIILPGKHGRAYAQELLKAYGYVRVAAAMNVGDPHLFDEGEAYDAAALQDMQTVAESGYYSLVTATSVLVGTETDTVDSLVKQAVALTMMDPTNEKHLDDPQAMLNAAGPMLAESLGLVTTDSLLLETDDDDEDEPFGE